LTRTAYCDAGVVGGAERREACKRCVRMNRLEAARDALGSGALIVRYPCSLRGSNSQADAKSHR